MAHTLLWAFGICAIIAILGYVGYTSTNGTSTLQQYVPSNLQQRFSTGDIMNLNLQPMSNARTQVFGVNPTNTIVTSNNPNASQTPTTTGTAPVSKPTNVTQSSVLNVAAGQSYGQTSQFKQVMPTDTYQLGNPVEISGSIQMVIPNSCVNINGQVTCQYVQPPIWHYVIIITCKIPENNNCAMDDHSTWGITDGGGNFDLKWVPSTDLNAGIYLITIEASSQVKSPQGQQYVLTQQKMANMVK